MPKRGGTLTVAATGGGSSDTLNPYNVFTATGALGACQLYDPVTRLAPDFSIELALAEELGP
jgi:hypothetical protein